MFQCLYDKMRTSGVASVMTGSKMAYSCIIQQIIETSFAKNAFDLFGTLLDGGLVCHIEPKYMKLLWEFGANVLKGCCLIGVTSRSDHDIRGCSC